MLRFRHTAPVFASLALLWGAMAPAAAQAVTTVYLVRHAETLGTAPDPGLSDLGVGRAADLWDVLRNAGLTAAYTPNTQRARSTAAPTVINGDLPMLSYSSLNRNDLRDDHPDEAVLVVADGDDLPGIVAALGGSAGFSVAPDEYDNLIRLRLEDVDTTVIRERYGPLTKLEVLRIVGDVVNGRDISGVVNLGPSLAVCADETSGIQEYEPRQDGKYDALPPFLLPVGNANTELDLEGLAFDAGTLYAVGSRPPSRSQPILPNWAQNRVALADTHDSSKRRRNVVYRVRVGGAGGMTAAGQLDLAGIILSDRFLKRFKKVPGQENGIDVEGLAIDGDWLVLGLRGPVLRGNFTPVLRIKPSGNFKRAKKLKVLFVDLDGRGIRGMTRVPTGFLILAGPVGHESQSFRVYHWDGEDMVPGERMPTDGSLSLGRATLLGTVPVSADAKAEGLTVLSETSDAYELLVVFDSAKDGAPTRFSARKVPGL